MAALLAAGFAHQRRGVGIAQLQDDMFVAECGQGIQQVVHIESDHKAVDLGVGLDLFLRLFLFGIVGVDLELTWRHLDAHAAILLVRQDRRALQRGSEGFTIDLHLTIGADREVKIDREAFRASLQRAAILSNEKYRGVRIEVSPGQLKINAHNPEQEEAQEEIEADTKVDSLVIGFNVNYLLDALSALRDEHVVLQLRDSNSSALVREASSEKCRHVVMPLRL